MIRFGAGDLLRSVALLGLACALSAAFPALGWILAGGGMWAVPYGIVRALYKTARGQPDPTRTAWWWVRGVLVCTLALAGALIGMSQRLQDCEDRARPVIAALEQFKAKRGVYPEKLAELVPDPLPVLDGIMYYPSKDREAYSLTYFPVMLLPLRHSYGPSTGKWMTWD